MQTASQHTKAKPNASRVGTSRNNMQAARTLSPVEAMKLANQIESLAHFHSRRLSDEASDHWFRTLTPFFGTSLEQVMTAAKNEKAMPSLGSVLEAVQVLNSRNKPEPAALRPLTAEERRRADVARKLSGLWLHYVKHKGMFFPDLLSVFGLGNADALSQAKAEYDEPTVRQWMADQERLDSEPAPAPATRLSGSWADL